MKKLYFFKKVTFVVVVLLASCSNKHKIKLTHGKLKATDSIINTLPAEKAKRLVDSIYIGVNHVDWLNNTYRLYFLSKIAQKENDTKEKALLSLQYIDSFINIVESNKLEDDVKNYYEQAFKDKVKICTAWGLDEEAASTIGKSIFLSTQNKDSCSIAENYKTLGYINFKQTKYDEAVSNYKKAISYVPFCKDSSDRFYKTQNYLNDLGLAFAVDKKYDSAIVYYHIAENYIINNKKLYARDTMLPWEALLSIYANLGQSYRNTNTTLAELYNKKALEIATDVFNDSSTIAQIQLFIADVYYIQGNYHKADLFLNTAIKNSKYFYLEDYRLWSRIGKDVAQKIKQPNKELFYAKEYIKYQDSTKKLESSLLKKNPQVEYERLDKKHKVELLEKDIAIHQNRNKASVIITLLSILAASIFYYYQRKVKKVLTALKDAIRTNELQIKQKQEEELYFQRVRLQIQANEQIVNERRKISNDLHDDLSGSLVALSYYIADLKQTATSEAEAAKLQNIGNEVAYVYQNARRYMHNLKSEVALSQYNLPKLLEEVSTKFNAHTSLKIILDIDSDKINNCLSIIQHDQLYHIVNEALSNCIKHSKSSEIQISIQIENLKTCHFCISDSGQGFDDRSSSSGMGIKSMKNRINELGGEIFFESLPNLFKVRGFFPL